MAEAELRILDSVRGTVEDFPEVHLHVGTASVLARVAMLESTEMRAGQTQMVQLRLAEALPLAPGDRFVVRANLPSQDQTGLATIGGGRILGLSNVRLRRKKAWTLAALTARRDALDDPERWAELMLREGAPLTAKELEGKCLRRPEEMKALLEKLLADGRAVALPNGAFTHRSVIEDIAGKMLQAVESFHAGNPQRAGLTRDELFLRVGGSAEISELAAAALLKSQRLETQGAVFARAGWRARVSDREQEFGDRIAAAFRSAGWTAPTAAELAITLNEPPPRVEKAMRLLTERAVLVKLDDKLCLHRDALEAARQVVLRLFAKKPSFSTMEFRDAVGVSRKYAVPVLDYLDRTRFTVRSGHDRTPGVEARKLMK
jgi:selenocysteine-specific elongation factor